METMKVVPAIAIAREFAITLFRKEQRIPIAMARHAGSGSITMYVAMRTMCECISI